jgi:hypothetical protein
MIEIKSGDICVVCDRPFKHKKRAVHLVGDPLPSIRFTICHLKCENKLSEYKYLKEELVTLFATHNVRILDIESD